MESLEKVKVVELTLSGGGTPLGPSGMITGIKGLADPSLRITVNFHLRNIPVTLHVSSS